MAGDVEAPQTVLEATKILREFLSRAFADSKEPVVAQVHVTSVDGWACKVSVESKDRKHGFAIPPMPEYPDMIFEAGEKVSRLAKRWGITWRFPEDALGKKPKNLIVIPDIRPPRDWK